MVTRTNVKFQGYDCIKLENETLALWALRSAGPRIIGLALQDGENLLAELPDFTVECPGEGTFHFRGGHRLWHAPEDLRRTYIPDNEAVSIDAVANGIRIIQPLETQTGIQKSITVTLPDQNGHVIVEHKLHNLGLWPVDLAPWAITQFKTGGVAILPLANTPADAHGLLPNRQIILWPYTKLNSPHIHWGERHIFIDAKLQDGALKLGYPNPIGWLGYALGTTLFIKRAEYQPEATYFDHGSSSECYCNPSFLELETLGPRARLAPGESVTHRESWSLYGPVDFEPNEDAVNALIHSLPT